ncbi:dynamin family protein [Bacillus licheniformis]
MSTPVTEKGITIVDTPGASSMNKRHTELAFQYMKDADALLYLTYYQHAFSKADRSFLRKLGLIKDAFSMDKMFFILNAADLAESPVELQTVEDYVRESS